jgi:sulfhydrogenase subunit delta
VALGDCAVTGCIQKIKNFQNKDRKIKYVYENIKRIDNFNIKPIKDYIKVDFEIPGCPITGNEFYKIVYYYLAGVQPKIFKRPVCYECQLQETQCLLQEGEACLGPVVLGGCVAVCPQAGYRCEGCRGLLPDANLINFFKLLKRVISLKDLNEMLQKFGIKEQWDKMLADAEIQNKVKED